MDRDWSPSHVHLFLQNYGRISLTSADRDRTACIFCIPLLCTPMKRRFPAYTEYVRLCRDKYTSRPRGFGFLTLSDEEAATQICQDTHTLDGRQVCFTARQCHILFPEWLCQCSAEMKAIVFVQIDAKRSLPQSQKPKLRKLFVGGLAPETTEGKHNPFEFPNPFVSSHNLCTFMQLQCQQHF